MASISDEVLGPLSEFFERMQAANGGMDDKIGDTRKAVKSMKVSLRHVYTPRPFALLLLFLLSSGLKLNGV